MKKILYILIFISLGVYAQNPAIVQAQLGVSIDVPKPPELKATPVLSNFTITDSQKSRVYFDSSADITGMTTTGFVISGKTISSVTIDGDGLGGYFTVSTPFTFWDNNTIRLGENDDTTHRQTTLYNFTLSYIENNISEPNASTNRYVEVGGTGDGTTIGNPASITYMATNAAAGQTWWIKAGNYGYEQIDLYNSGTVDNPIKYIGYKTTPGDITSNYIQNYNDISTGFSSTEMPTLTGVMNTSSIAITLNGEFIILRNIQTTEYKGSIKDYTTLSDVVIDNFNSKDNYDTSYTDFYGINIWNSTLARRIRITNSVLLNHSLAAIQFKGDVHSHYLIDNVKVYNDVTNNTGRQDYAIATTGDNGIVRNCVLENFNSTGTNGSTHGITLRAQDYGHADYNLFELNNITNFQEGVAIRNAGASKNVVKDTYIGNNNTTTISGRDSGGIWFFGTGDYNIVERILAEDMTTAIGYRGDGTESSNVGVGNNNIVRNSIFNNCSEALYISNGYDSNVQMYNNSIVNCTFNDIDNFIYQDGSLDIQNNIFKNNIVTGISSVGNNSQYLSDINIQYSNLYNNGSWDDSLIGSTGNIAINPNFTGTYVPQGELQVVSKIFGVEYDYNGKERDGTTTIGAVTMASEQAGEVTPPTYTPDYYVSSSTGNDSNDGLTEGTAWATLSKVESEYNSGTFNTGKIVAFKSGDTFIGDLSLENDSGTSGSEIVFTSYGAGNKPIISNIQDYSDITWTSLAGNIWYETVLDREPTRVKIDGQEVLGEFSQYSNLGTSIPDLVEFFYGDNGVNGEHLYVYSTVDPNTRTFEFSSHKSGGNYENKTIGLTNTDYVILDNLDIQGGYVSSILLRNVNNVTIQNCNIGNMSRFGVTSEFETTQSTNITIKDNNFDSNYTFDYSSAGTYAGASSRGAVEGIRIVALTGGEISNNTFDNWCHASVSMTSSNQETITGVVIFNNDFALTSMPYGGGITLDGLNNSGNEVYNNYTYGVKAHQINGHDNHFHHNLIVDSKTSSIHTTNTGHGILVQNYYEGAHDNIIENNVVYNSEGAGLRMDSGNPYGNIIRNNIFYTTGAEYLNIALYTDTSGSNTYENNLIYQPAKSDCIRFKGNYITVTTFNTDAEASNNLSSNPLFVGASDYHLQSGSPARNAGTPALSTTDYEGNTMSTTTPDIGIYEHN